MAIANNYAYSEFMSLLGFAQINKFENDRKSACYNVKKDEHVFQKKIGQKLGPITRKIIDDIGCEFSFKKED